MSVRVPLIALLLRQVITRTSDILNNGHRYKIIANGHSGRYNDVTTVMKLSL